MPKRYFLSPIIGTGTFSDPYRVKNNGANSAAIIPSNPDGSPKFSYSLCLMSADSLTTLLADITLSALPDLQMTDTISALQSTQISGAILSRLGASITVSAGETFASVLRKVGRVLDPNFDESTLQAAR